MKSLWSGNASFACFFLLGYSRIYRKFCPEASSWSRCSNSKGHMCLLDLQETQILDPQHSMVPQAPQVWPKTSKNNPIISHLNIGWYVPASGAGIVGFGYIWVKPFSIDHWGVFLSIAPELWASLPAVWPWASRFCVVCHKQYISAK